MGATVNKRSLQAYHGGAAVSTAVINGIAAGGLMSAQIDEGYDDIITAPHDGNNFPTTDRLTQFCRGTITSQDWITMLSVLNGTTGTYVFYEKESGVDTVTKHTLVNPVIFSAAVSLGHRSHGSCAWSFECKAADDTTGFSVGTTPFHQVDNGAAAPSAITAKGRSLEMTATTHSGNTINHVIGLDFTLAAQLVRASQDGDVGYTAVDKIYSGTPVSGTITFQESIVSDGDTRPQVLLADDPADLVVAVKQEQGGSNKTLTINDVMFTSLGASYDSGTGYRTHTMPFIVSPQSGVNFTSATVITIA